MTSSIKMKIYRVLATIVILVPVVLNTVFVSDIITSLIYVPLLVVTLTCLAILLDTKLLKSNKSTGKRLLKSHMTKVKLAPLKQPTFKKFHRAA